MCAVMRRMATGISAPGAPVAESTADSDADSGVRNAYVRRPLNTALATAGGTGPPRHEAVGVDVREAGVHTLTGARRVCRLG
jgi:hypothetical protein